MFQNHIKNQHDKLLNGTDIYGLYFQGGVAIINYTLLLNILAEGVHIPVLVQNILDCTGHITGGHKKNAKFLAGGFFDTMNFPDPEKKLLDLYMFNGDSVCRKAQKVFKVVYPMLLCILGADHTFHNVFKG